MANWKNVALLVSGAFISVLSGALLLLPPVPRKWVLVMLSIPTLVLFLYGSGLLSWVEHRLHLLRRRGVWGLRLKVGILDDMGWDVKDEQTHAHTDIGPREWMKLIQEVARDTGERIATKLIDVRKDFDSFIAVLNPYGAVYPEEDIYTFPTLGKILDYVGGGGVFINVADIPGYFGYQAKIERKVDTTPAIYSVDAPPMRPFELTPLMQKLGIRVFNVEKNEKLCKWRAELRCAVSGLCEDLGEITVQRVAKLERNVQLVAMPVSDCTPIFWVNYGQGRFLISLVFLSKQDFPENECVKKALAKILVGFIKQNAGQRSRR